MRAAEILEGALGQLRLDCADLRGALIATPEGLLLASCGAPEGETAAALASHLADSLDLDLALLAGTACTESLLWTQNALWGVARLESGHVVLVHAIPECRAANLRLAIGRLRRDLRPALGLLGA